jgi:amino acid adenylation domain-containing protein
MNDLNSLLTKLKTIDVKLSVEGDRLRINAPSGVLTPELKTELSMHKTQLLDLMRQVAPNRDNSFTIPSAPRGEPLALSFAQERMWFLEQLYPDSATYNGQLAYRLTGTLSVDALKQSMQTLIQRHEVLRTVYRQVDDKPVQVVLPVQEIALSIYDLAALPAAEQEAEIRRLALQDARQPFDLVNGPIYRTLLLRLAENEHILIQSRHHIATDGWSAGVYWREFNELYNAYRQGQTPSLPDLPIQYVDYALWQREWLERETGARQREYWQKQLADLPPLELPVDSISQSTDHKGGAAEALLSSKLTAQLHVLAQRERATPFMVLLAAFQLLLHRQSGQDDFAIGTPIFNRNRTETEHLIGCIINTLVIRANLSKAPSFRTLLQRVRKAVLEAFEHQELPIEKIIEDLQPTRHLNRTPFFQVLINMLDVEAAQPQLGALAVERVAFAKPRSKFEMTLYVRRFGDSLRLRLVYRTDLFSAERMAHLLDQYVYLLEQIVEQPDQPISAFSLVTPQSRALLPDPTQPLTEPAYPGVLETFLEVAETEPGRVAIEQGRQQWSYTDLAATASAIATALQENGMKPHHVVAISGPRSFELVASLLGVMICGGVFMLLDPNLPEKRREIMSAEADPDYLIEIQDSDQQQPGHRPITIVSLRGKDSSTPIDLAQSRSTPPEVNIYAPDDPLYIFFTSGSTGKPKGIRGCYKSLNHFIHWQRQTFQISSTDRVAQLTTLSFDAVLRDIFLPLTAGSTLCLPPQGLVVSDELTWLAESQITVLHVVPSRAKLWLQPKQNEPKLHLRYTFFAGEPLLNTFAAQWRKYCPADSYVVNLYGPSETTMVKAYTILADNSGDGIQPLEHVQPETQLLIVNHENNLCGIGERGEIVIRTPFSTLGYLNPAFEDAARFQVNIFTGQPGDIVYRTGDSGRYQPDGSVSILGRLDLQIKVSGVRVEPHEIEVVISKHPGVNDCTVMATEQSSGEAKLIAYIVPAQKLLDLDELRRYLSNWLPMPMIPAVFLLLPSLPLLPNGKVDRHTLSTLPLPSAQVTRSTEEARDLLDIQMKAIWASVLNVPSVKLDDNFFDVGGHSLLAVTLFAQIEQLTGKRLPLSILFEAPTIRHLTDAMRRSNWRSPWRYLVAIQPTGHKRPIFLVPPAGGSALRFNKLTGLMSADRPIFSFDSLGLDGLSEPHNTVEEMAAAYIQEMRLIQSTGPYLVGGMCYGAHVALEIAQQLQAGGQEVSMLVILDAGAPDNGPTWAIVVPKRTLLRYIKRTIYHLRQKTFMSVVFLPKIKRFVQRVTNAINSLDPVSARIQKVKKIHVEAQQRYHSRAYNGNLILFQTEDYYENGHSQKWMNITPDLTLYVMPGTKHRAILRNEPYMQQWTAQLKQHLDDLPE